METRKRIYCALGGFILGVLVTLVIWMFSVSGIGTDVPADSDGVLGQENGIGREETDVADGAGKEPGEDDSPSGSDPATPTEAPAKEPGEDGSPSGSDPATPTEAPAKEPGEDGSPSGSDPIPPTEVPAKEPGEDGSPSGSDPAPPTEAPAKEPEEDTGSAGDGGVAVPEPSVGTWDKSAVYTGGDTVSYGGRRYRAKWWTQGEQPDRSDVWEDFGIVDGEPAKPEGVENTPVDASVPKDTALTDFKVVGYYPSWKPGKLSAVDFGIVTHVCYAFAIPTSDGGLRDLENPDTARALIKSAHANGAKVLLSIGGWSYNDTPLENVFMEATSDDAKTARFAENIVAMCTEYGFDGVDMDWEHPRVDGTSAKQYEALMLILSEKLHGEGKLLTAAVLSGATADGNIYYDAAAHTNAVLNAVDFINVMAYDGGDGERHSQYRFAVDCGTYWKETRGLPAHKVVLGVPFYARPSWADYGMIVESVPDAYSKDHTAYNGMDVHYNGVDTIKKKTEYAKENLGGIMIWELTQDTGNAKKSLLQAIGECLQ